ncbi:MAG: hypothetical protein Q9208_007486 [Pyrenodesmia sp. 3 TL-2023]
MATALAEKPAPPHQKMKRPPLPTVQTTVNGTGSPPPSSSPSLNPKMLSTASSNQHKKPGHIQARPSRPSKGRQTETALDRRKRMATPYVKTRGYILKKYRGSQPSLIVHLHPTFFRFDQQDGNWPYESDMKSFLEHLVSQTVPHDMIEELHNAGVTFYEDCLIVRVIDHKGIAVDSRTSAASTASDKDVPASIHNYNEHLTPSPFVPYPKSTCTDAKADISVSGKEAAQDASATRKPPVKGPRIFHTVLLPTPQSMEEDMRILANNPESRSTKRKQSQVGGASRTPASATVPHPPTPLSAVPPTPITGQANKKQKTSVGESNRRVVESMIDNATGPKLYLEPVGSLEEASQLIQTLSDPLHKRNLPSPKTRKRTVAELEADEAQAASEQQFMHIMDEGGKPVLDFERFKAIEKIKAAHKAKEQEMQEQRVAQQAQVQANNKIKQEQAEQFKMLQERKNAEITAQRQQQERVQAMQQKTLLQQQHLAANQNMHGHGPATNGVMPNQQHMPPNTQPPHSSPIARNMTPHSNPRSSPLVGSVPHSVPMNVTSSGQGIASSPARPTSAAQHGHPAGGVAMAPNRSQQRPPSRIGTPSMPHGTPTMHHGSPVIKQGTPTPHTNQASPPHTISHSPMMNANGIAAQHLNMGALTPEQARSIERRKVEQQRRAHMLYQQNMASNMSGNNGMSPMHMGAQNASLQHYAAQNNQQIRNYHAQQQEYARAMNGGMPNQMMPSATPNPHARPMPPQPPHRPPQQMSQQQSKMAHMQNVYQNQAYQNITRQLIHQYGALEQIPPERVNEAKAKAVHMARQQIRQAAQRQQQMMQQAQMAGANGMGGAGSGMAMGGAGGTNGMSNMNGMNGMGGMNGLGGMNGMQ